MTDPHTPDFAELTTLQVGGPVGAYRPASTRSELIDLLVEYPLTGETPEPEDDVLVLGGGSNLVVADAGFPGTVVHVQTGGIEVERAAADSDAEAALVRVDAGMNWDDVVADTLSRGLSGLETLSGIPGSAGATPVQNVGAYGTEVAQYITRVRVFDRQAGTETTMTPAECRFGYRDSLFKRTARRLGRSRYIVLDVEFRLAVAETSAPIAYAELARALGVAVGDRTAARDVRSAVLRLRAGKGMLLDPADPDTVSAGSFFTNPIIDPDVVPDGAPAWPMDGMVKTSAAWLIDHAGFPKGFGLRPEVAALSTKHTLALTNRGRATASDIIELAQVVADGVNDRFGIRLQPEPALVGCSL